MHCNRGYTRESVDVHNGFVPMDIKDSGYAAKIWLYIFCGLLDAMWQTTAYWMMGAMSNDPAKLAYLTGFCTLCVCITETIAANVLYACRQIHSVGRCCWYVARRWCGKAVRSRRTAYNVLHFISCVRYMQIFASTWALLVAGLLFALPMLYFRVKNHTELEDEAM